MDRSITPLKKIDRKCGTFSADDGNLAETHGVACAPGAYEHLLWTMSAVIIVLLVFISRSLDFPFGSWRVVSLVSGAGVLLCGPVLPCLYSLKLTTLFSVRASFSMAVFFLACTHLN